MPLFKKQPSVSEKGASSKESPPKAAAKPGSQATSKTKPVKKASKTGPKYRFKEEFVQSAEGREIHGVTVENSEWCNLNDCPDDFKTWVKERKPWSVETKRS